MSIRIDALKGPRALKKTIKRAHANEKPWEWFAKEVKNATLHVIRVLLH
jgi:hypothetical protein